MGQEVFTTTKSRAVRLTKLDDCGVPTATPKGSLVTYGFVKAENKLDIEDGEKFELQNAWGDYCVNEKDKPKIKGADVAIDFCAVQPDSYGLVSGARVIAATVTETFATLGDSIGYVIGEDTEGTPFAIEMWSKVAGAVCGAGGAALWVYTVWPFLEGGRPGDQTFERGTTTFTQSATARGASASWGNGPYASPVMTLNAGEIMGQVLTAVQPPVETDGAVALVVVP